MLRPFAPGDWVIYRKTKHSPHPGPRASNVTPAKAGDLYGYTVDKFWIVRSIDAQKNVTLETRTGKQHVVGLDDPALRRASWWQRLRYRSRYLAIEERIRRGAEGSSAATSEATSDEQPSKPPAEAVR